MKDNIKGRLISNHPVHILDAEGHLSPSSLIPFCEFGENKSIMAMDIEKFNVIQICRDKSGCQTLKQNSAPSRDKVFFT